eukprot:795810-Lingulodinium_polyedra.AAC.1
MAKSSWYETSLALRAHSGRPSEMRGCLATAGSRTSRLALSSAVSRVSRKYFARIVKSASASDSPGMAPVV